MADYKISQNTKEPLPKSIKNFWAPSRQQKVLQKRTVVISIIVSVIIIAVGAVFATIKLRGQSNPTNNQPIYLHGTHQSVNNQNQSFYAIDANTFNNVSNAISSKNAALLKNYYAAQVHVIIVNSLTNEIIGNDKVADVIANAISGAQSPWNFHVPPSELSGWQAGPYGQYFDGIDEVGVSTDGTVISVGFNTDGQIDSVLIAPSGDLDSTTPPTQPDQTPPEQETPPLTNSINTAD